METIMSRIILAIFCIFLFSTQALAQVNHPDTRIDYWSADEGPWSAVWDGNGFIHRRLDGSGEVRHSINLDYETWDHSKWSATWDIATGQFRHVNITTGEVRYSNRIDYTAADKSKWTAIRIGPNSFYHIFVAKPDETSSNVFGQVIQFLNDNKETIRVVIQAATIVAG
jgi:hypothetical protein